ncbi:MAG: hypothetical protein JW714_01110 [Candidatus Omnitrophica bacterium]|nr:hypothetical protein [Candidatus Omnitrophota bacterium]
MIPSGIYNWWHQFRKGEVTGQVATLITLAIAVIFLFVAVTLNVSKVSQRRTVVGNAADGAALLYASGVGSYANKLSQEYLDGKKEKCETNIMGILMLGVAVIMAVFAIYCIATLPALVPATGATIGAEGVTAVGGEALITASGEAIVAGEGGALVTASGEALAVGEGGLLVTASGEAVVTASGAPVVAAGAGQTIVLGAGEVGVALNGGTVIAAGEGSTAIASGAGSTAMATGKGAVVMASGEGATATAVGKGTVALATGKGATATTQFGGTAVAEEGATAVATGEGSKAVAIGEGSKAAASEGAESAASGKGASATASGKGSKAWTQSGAKGSATEEATVAKVPKQALADLSGTSSAISGGGAGAEMFVFQPKVAERIQKMISHLPTNQQISEQAVYYALKNIVDNPNKVPDVFDDDKDRRRGSYADGSAVLLPVVGNREIAGDAIGEFEYWYMRRLSLLRTVVDVMAPLIDSFMPRMEEFSQEANYFRSSFTEDGQRPIAIEGCAECPDATVITAGQNGEFVDLLEDLYYLPRIEIDALGLEITVNDPDPQIQAFLNTFWQDGVSLEDKTFDEVDELSWDLQRFYEFATGGGYLKPETGLTRRDTETLLQTSDQWIGALYFPEGQLEQEVMQSQPWYEDWQRANDSWGESLAADSQGHWHAIWQQHTERIDNWNRQLYAVHSRLNELIDQEADPLRRTYLRNLQNRTYSDQSRLNNFKNRLNDFNLAIEEFYADLNRARGNAVVEGIANVGTNVLGRLFSVFGVGIGGPGMATYSWRDSLGWHHADIFATPFKMPKIEAKKKGMTETCLVLKNYDGGVLVFVTRFDEHTASSLMQRGSLGLGGSNFDPGNPDQALPHGIVSSAGARYHFQHLPNLLFAR